MLISALKKPPGTSALASPQSIFAPMTFEQLYPNLAPWAELGHEIQINNPGARTLIVCLAEGAPIYQSPTDLKDVQKALYLAEAAVGEWIDENEDD